VSLFKSLKKRVRGLANPAKTVKSGLKMAKRAGKTPLGLLRRGHKGRSAAAPAWGAGGRAMAGRPGGWGSAKRSGGLLSGGLKTIKKV